ncbi:hypothetical protein Hdeb2414_s0003g00116251 [Helianthus debilis subsp. tardiflorus]
MMTKKIIRHCCRPQITTPQELRKLNSTAPKEATLKNAKKASYKLVKLSYNKLCKEE